MNEKIEKVHRFLEDNGIEYQTHYHPPLPTIELALEYWKDIDSTHWRRVCIKGNFHSRQQKEWTGVLDCNQDRFRFSV